jgi:hypothetical protein
MGITPRESAFPSVHVGITAVPQPQLFDPAKIAGRVL